MSLIEQTEKQRRRAWLVAARERALDDFRYFRFTWLGALRWTGIVLGAFLIAAIITLYFLDWNQMRGPIGRWLSQRTGREVRINGNLAVELFSWQPSLDVGGLFIGNPGWVKAPHAGTVRHARVEMRLVPFLLGRTILPLVVIDQPDILLVRDAQGRTNWDINGENPNQPLKLPPIRRFLVNRGHVEIDDAVRKLRFTGAVTSRESRGAAPAAAFTLSGDGTLNANKFLADVKGGALINVDESKPYAFTADVHSAQTHAVISGQITHPFNLDRFTATATFSGPSLGDLYDLTGLALPRTPAYRIAGSLVRNGTLYRFSNVKGVVGQSDLTGDLSVETAGKIPMLTGKLSSHVLDFKDLGTLLGGGALASAAGPHLLPDTVLHTEKLRQMNGEVDYQAAAIRSQDFPLTGLDTHVSVENGVLDLNPLAFGFTRGKLSGSLKIDARNDTPVTSLDARLTDLHAESFIPGAEKPLQGTLEARAQITGTGASVHRAASTANGTFTAVVPDGRMRRSLAEWLGVDVISALGLNLSGDQSNTRLRCAVAHFEARQGLLTSQQFVFDTDPVRVDGQGTVNLKDETMDLTLQGKPKSFQLVRLRAPITVTGSLAKPEIGVKAGPLITQTGIGAALALINPLAAVLAFVDPGMAKDANCAGLLTTAKAQGAPVKASAVRAAPAPRK